MINIILKILQIILGLIFLISPGFLFSYIIYKKIKFIERIALSIVISIILVPLVIFYSGLAGIAITFLNSFLVILILLAIGMMILLRQKRKRS